MAESQRRFLPSSRAVRSSLLLDAKALFIDWIARYEYPALFLLLVLGIVGLPIPDETLLLASASLAGLAVVVGWRRWPFTRRSA